MLTRAQRLLGQLPKGPFHADAAHNLGQAFYGLGDYQQAISSYQAAADLSGELGDHSYEAEILGDLTDAYSAAGRHGEAVGACEQALVLLAELDHPDTVKARSKLEKLKAETGTTLSAT